MINLAHADQPDNHSCRVKPVLWRLSRSPAWLITLIVVSVFTAEFIVMSALSFFPEIPLSTVVWLDPLVLLILLTPVIAIFILRPLSLHISSSEKNEKLLALERNKLKGILDTMEDGVCIVNKSHQIEYINDALQKEFGQVAGRRCYEYIQGRTGPCPFCTHEKVFDGNSARWELTSEITGKTYERFDTPIGNADGTISKMEIFHDITDYKRVLGDLEDSREQLRNLNAHIQAVREEERATIAREIHDELGQMLTALKMDLSWLGKRLSGEQFQLLNKTREMAQHIDVTITTVQRISAELRPDILDDLGLMTAIEWQAKEFQKRTGIICKVQSRFDCSELDRGRSTALFRIFQEALTNIYRHAEATRVWLTMRLDGGNVVAKIKDNGKGISEQQIDSPNSFGIIGMRERARFFGGEITINPLPEGGTSIQVTIPVNPGFKEEADDKDTHSR